MNSHKEGAPTPDAPYLISAPFTSNKLDMYYLLLIALVNDGDIN